MKKYMLPLISALALSGSSLAYAQQPTHVPGTLPETTCMAQVQVLTQAQLVNMGATRVLVPGTNNDWGYKLHGWLYTLRAANPAAPLSTYSTPYVTLPLPTLLNEGATRGAAANDYILSDRVFFCSPPPPPQESCTTPAVTMSLGQLLNDGATRGPAANDYDLRERSFTCSQATGIGLTAQALLANGATSAVGPNNTNAFLYNGVLYVWGGSNGTFIPAGTCTTPAITESYGQLMNTPGVTRGPAADDYDLNGWNYVCTPVAARPQCPELAAPPPHCSWVGAAGTCPTLVCQSPHRP